MLEDLGLFLIQTIMAQRMGLVSGLNSMWCTQRVVLSGTSEKTSPNSSSKAVKSSVWVEVSWPLALDKKSQPLRLR